MSEQTGVSLLPSLDIIPPPAEPNSAAAATRSGGGDRGPSAAARKAADDDDGPTFAQILSALNPLQYLPVVGTIYRAITGDVVPEGLRVVGSFAVSALTGGPLGMLLNAAMTVAEKVTGIDPETIVADLAGRLGLHGGGDGAPPIAEAGSVSSAPPSSPALPASPAARSGGRPAAAADAMSPAPPPASVAAVALLSDPPRRAAAPPERLAALAAYQRVAAS